MSVIVKFYLLNSLVYLVCFGTIYILLLRSITGPVSISDILTSPLMLALLSPLIILVIAFFLAHKYTGFAFHAVPPVIIAVLVFLIPAAVQFVKEHYIPVDYEELHYVCGGYYIAKGKRIDRKKNGVFKYYDPDTGILHHEAVWSKDILDGYSVFYYPDGQKEMEGNLKASNDLPIDFEEEVCRYGKWFFYNKDGSVRDTRIYNNDGTLRSSEACRLYQKKESENLYRVYELKTMLPFTGTIIREAIIADEDVYPYHTTAEIKDGYIQGAWEEFSSFDGLVLVSRGNSKLGYIDGAYTSYYEDGKVYEKAFLSMGKFDGEYKAFYQNGNSKAVIFFKENKRQGLAQWFYENGNLETEIEYGEAGNVINERYFDKDGNLISDKD